MDEVKIIGTENGEMCVELSGDIDLGNAEAFYQAVMEGYKAFPANIEFECKKLNFIDSTTLGTFVKILKTVKQDGFSMRLTGLQPKIKKLFLICSLDSIMRLE